MHENALTRKAAPLFKKIDRFRGFYLVGGTALALHIGHRVSVDLDLFSKAPLPARLLADIKRIFHGASIAVTYRAPGQLSLTVNGVKMTFFEYEYPVIDALVTWRGTPLTSILEIAAMKAYAIGKRISYKDYVDWYFLLQERHVRLADVIAHAKKKFGGDFNDRLFLGQLVSLEDVTTQKIDFLRDAVSRETILRFLKKTVRTFILPSHE